MCHTTPLKAKPKPITIIQIYAPTSSSDENIIEQFYDQLQTTVDKVSKGDISIIMGDLNAKIGEGEDTRCGIGKFGLGIRNESGDKLAEFCHANEFIITNTLFDHHKRNRYTWISPGDRCRNQIDYIMIKKRWKSSINDCKTYPGADCDTDHILLLAKMRVKLARNQTKPKQKKIDVRKLEDPGVRSIFIQESERSFEAHILSQIDDQADDESSESLWTAYSTILSETANKILGEMKRNPKKPWISNEVLKLAEDKSKLRKNRNTPAEDQRYKDLRSEIQRKLRKDKASWLEEQCQKIGEHDKMGQSKKMFDMI